MKLQKQTVKSSRVEFYNGLEIKARGRNREEGICMGTDKNPSQRNQSTRLSRRQRGFPHHSMDTIDCSIKVRTGSEP